MKAKVKLDSASLKQFALDHFEKALFGLVVLVFLLFVYKAVGRETLNFTPEDLVREAERAKTNLKNSQPTDVPKLKEYTKEAPRIRQPIDPSPYAVKTFAAPVFPQMAPRTSPQVFPVEDVRAVAGQGAFSTSTVMEEQPSAVPMMGAGSQIRGQRWVCVTALIPHAKYYEAFKLALENARYRDPARDFPLYRYYYIERAEVDPQDPDADPANLTWVRLNPRRALYKAQLQWTTFSQEIVDRRFWPVHPFRPHSFELMMFPLGPRTDRPWGEEVAHLPEITLAQTPQMGMGMEGYPMGPMGTMPGAVPAAKTTPPDEFEEGGEGAKVAPKKSPKRPQRPRFQSLDEIPDEPEEGAPVGGFGGEMMPGGYPGGHPGGPMRMPMMPSARSPMSGAMPPGYPPEMSSGYPSSAGGYPGMPGMGPEAYGQYAEEEYIPEDYLLLRFFDFEVEAGKYYRYRVKLLVDNPNNGLPPRVLAQPDLAGPRWLEADWSEPSAVVNVPLDSQVLVVSASPKPAQGEPSAKVLLVRFDMDSGIEAFKEFEKISRGQWLNYLKQEFDRAAAGLASSPMMGMGAMYPSPDMAAMGPPGMPMPGTPYGMARRPGAGEEEEKEYVDYVTDCLVLDIAGGSTLPGREREKLTEPGRILLMDKDGHLLVRNEIDDLPEVSRHHVPEKETPGALAAPGYPSPDMMMSPSYAIEAMGAGAKKPAKGAKGKKSGGYYPGGMPPGYPGAEMGPGYPGNPGAPGAKPGRGKTRPGAGVRPGASS